MIPNRKVPYASNTSSQAAQGGDPRRERNSMDNTTNGEQTAERPGSRKLSRIEPGHCLPPNLAKTHTGRALEQKVRPISLTGPAAVARGEDRTKRVKVPGANGAKTVRPPWMRRMPAILARWRRLPD
jgi:hypothetical protein